MARRWGTGSAGRTDRPPGSRLPDHRGRATVGAARAARGGWPTRGTPTTRPGRPRGPVLPGHRLLDLLGGRAVRLGRPAPPPRRARPLHHLRGLPFAAGAAGRRRGDGARLQPAPGRPLRLQAGGPARARRAGGLVGARPAPGRRPARALPPAPRGAPRRGPGLLGRPAGAGGRRRHALRPAGPLPPRRRPRRALAPGEAPGAAAPRARRRRGAARLLRAGVVGPGLARPLRRGLQPHRARSGLRPGPLHLRPRGPPGATLPRRRRAAAARRAGARELLPPLPPRPDLPGRRALPGLAPARRPHRAARPAGRAHLRHRDAGGLAGRGAGSERGRLRPLQLLRLGLRDALHRPARRPGPGGPARRAHRLVDQPRQHGARARPGPVPQIVPDRETAAAVEAGCRTPGYSPCYLARVEG